MIDPDVEQKCEELFGKYIDFSNWIFAKSMANIPHSYTLRRESLNQQMFTDLVIFIRTNGYQEKFFKQTYTYFKYKGYKYWTMGAEPELTTLINRAAL